MYIDNAAGLSQKRRGLPEIWISGGQMSGEDDDTDAGSSVQIYRKKYNKSQKYDKHQYNIKKHWQDILLEKDVQWAEMMKSIYGCKTQSVQWL